jgi:hypothetical protein
VDLLIESFETNTTSINSPKLSSPVFELKNNYFVVTDGTIHNYYTIKVHPDAETDSLIRFERSPPVILEGLAIINKRIFKVTVDDLLRRIIRKSREIKLEVLNGTSSTSSKSVGDIGTTDITISTETSFTTSPATTIQGIVQQRVEHKTEMEEHAAADAAWQEQIGTLLGLISKEEGDEWEITEAT